MIPLRKLKFNRFTFLAADIDDIIKSCKIAMDSADQSDVAAARVMLNVLGVRTTTKAKTPKKSTTTSTTKKWEVVLEIVRNHPNVSSQDVERLLPKEMSMDVSSMLSDLAKKGALRWEKTGRLKYYTCIPEWRPAPCVTPAATRTPTI